MDSVARQILRALRGRRSQVAFARRLGYRGNPITDWERGCTYPTAQEALRAAQKTGVDVVAALRRFGNLTIEADATGYLVGPWLNALAGVSPTELSRRVGRSRSSVSRWLSGKAQPRLPAFLSLVDAATGRLPDLVSELVPIDEVPALRGRQEAAMAARRLAFDAPWTEAILRLLETRAYAQQPRHEDCWLADILGLKTEDIVQCLALLEAAGLVRLDQQRYVNVDGLSVDTRGGKQALHALKAHWANVAAARACDPVRGDLLAYNVVSTSSQDMQRIDELLMETYREVRAIVAASHPAERVGLVNIHFIKWPKQSAEPD